MSTDRLVVLAGAVREVGRLRKMVAGRDAKLKHQRQQIAELRANLKTAVDAVRRMRDSRATGQTELPV